MNNPNSIKTQVIKLPVDTKINSSSPEKKNAGEKPAVIPIASNLSPASKQLLGRSSKKQLIALAASVPLFSAMGYGMAKADIFINPGTDTHPGHSEISGTISPSAHGSHAASGVIDNTDLNPKMAVSVTEDESFAEAFESARAEVGPGNYFIWNGNLYGTFYKEEWDRLSDDQKAGYYHSLPHDTLPDFTSSVGQQPVLVQNDVTVEPGTLHVEDNQVVQIDDNGQSLLNDKQVDIQFHEESNATTDSEKFAELQKDYDHPSLRDKMQDTVSGIEHAVGGLFHHHDAEPVDEHNNSAEGDPESLMVFSPYTGEPLLPDQVHYDPNTGESLDPEDRNQGHTRNEVMDDVVDDGTEMSGYYDPTTGQPIPEDMLCYDPNTGMEVYHQETKTGDGFDGEFSNSGDDLPMMPDSDDGLNDHIH